MNETELSLSERPVRKTAHRRKRRKKKNPGFLILLLLVFALGFVLGLYVGINQQQEINFVLSSDEQSSNQGLPWYLAERKDYSNLPWYLTLVNYEYGLTADFAPETLAEADNGYMVDARIAEAARNMIADAKNEGVKIIALSAYRDYEYQENLYNNKVRRLKREKGYSEKRAREEAGTVVAYPGTSEHQLGLALDLVDAGHTRLDESQESTAAYQWLVKHCHEYGFIVRYPNGKTDITGIIYEPWHFRYVGEEAAGYIMEQGICLEEYLWETCQ